VLSPIDHRSFNPIDISSRYVASGYRAGFFRAAITVRTREKTFVQKSRLIVN
jgi:hypothetical protein